MSSHHQASAAMHAQILRAIEKTRDEAHSYLTEARPALAFASTPIEKVLAAAEFVRNSKIGMAALRMWHATIHYHAWCKREDWAKWNHIGVSDIAEQSERLPSSSGFDWNGHAWRFTLEKNGSSCSGESELGTFRLMVDNEVVMELAVAKGYGEFDEWYETDVNALNVGPWAGALIDMWAELELAQRRKWATAEATRLNEQASRIKLG